MFDQIISKLKAGESNISTDTRTLQVGDIFFAIKGEQFDGHDFVQQALEKGASICVVDAGYINPDFGTEDSRLLKVEDTVRALQQLATEYRETLGIPVIAITGCNGKTTTKNFMASVLTQKFDVEKVAYTKGNLNNFIGLPLSILSIKSSDEIAVLELGSNHPGEIEFLCAIAKPTYGITTSIGAAHIEFFGTVEAIADEEGAIALSLPKIGLYVVPKNDQYSEYLLNRTSARKSAVDIKHIECLGVEFLNFQSKLNKIGISAPHIVTDALLVTAIAHDLGVSGEQILKGLSETKNDKGRFDILKREIASLAIESVGSNTANASTTFPITIIDDTYNANPDSVIAAIKATKELFPNERKIVCLGVLKELGDYLHTGYERIVNVCNEDDVAELVLIGITDTFENIDIQTRLIYVNDNVECVDYLKKSVKVNDVILCKGSHGAKMWEVVECFK
ncbi:MAG: UDP-N-acetylmuramoyl-tripeptide--D-alanyl-D-alanine ligase [Candidatus Pacebacteria bacterium]|nr:UDP-N-acetylmuramoyl-tripeptide--D-alanyl-D-alanine ligase [Candidatus Paceibacterota bacterium]MBP9818617.1 UDP-N-acetylmuramoyl-tripeptide--D-alanyl-D-alanine ligase [Candidatus Paceibacterota bacterium]